MSESDRLRSMLDERGVEYEAYAYVLDEGNRVEITRVRDNKSGRIIARFMSCDEPGKVDVAAKLTPEQAIAATLGDERIEGLEANWNAAKASASRWRERCVEYESRCYELESLLRDMYSQLRELGIEVDYER